jgi:predicted GIY-YIG superfamily endonuclease
MRIPRHLPDTANARQGRTALYRFYDARGDLLYVGITNSPHHRFAQHRDGSDWWEHAASRRIHWYDTRHEALRAEYVAIRRERPIFNRMHNRNRLARYSYRPPGPTRRPMIATMAGGILLAGAWSGSWEVPLPVQILTVIFTLLAGYLTWTRFTE